MQGCREVRREAGLLRAVNVDHLLCQQAPTTDETAKRSRAELGGAVCLLLDYLHGRLHRALAPPQRPNEVRR